MSSSRLSDLVQRSLAERDDVRVLPGKVAAFRHSTDNKAETFASMVDRFQGRLVLDASSAHDDALCTGRITWADCNAHGPRKVRDSRDSDPVLAAEGERRIASWFDQERVARDRGLGGAHLLAWRQRPIGPLVDDFRRWLEAVHPTALPKAPLAEATRSRRQPLARPGRLPARPGRPARYRLRRALPPRAGPGTQPPAGRQQPPGRPPRT